MKNVKPLSSKPHKEGLRARREALELLKAVLLSRRPFEEALEAVRPTEGLSIAIAREALRRKASFDKIIEARLHKDLPDHLPQIELVLLIGLTQLLALPSIKDHAAIDLSVELLKNDRHAKPFAPLVNAILRGVQRDGLVLPESLDLPTWLEKRWAHYPPMLSLAFEPTLDLTVKSDASLWAEKLGGIVLPTGSVRLIQKSSLKDLEGYEAGEWFVQDAAASLPARLLHAKTDEDIADFCAAPGGKTAQLALTGAKVTAYDRSKTRLMRLDENMRRLGLNVALQQADLLTLEGEQFDAILLDAPCTATGTLRSNPDVMWLKSDEDVEKLAKTQRALLTQAFKNLKTGGRLVYCTCSLEIEEGEAQIEGFLKENPSVKLDKIQATELEGLESFITSKGFMRATPAHFLNETPRLSGADGFFAARLIKE